MKKYIGRILFVLCVTISIAGIIYIANYYIKRERNHAIYEKLQEEAMVPQEEPVVESEEEPAPEIEEVTPYVIKNIDFAALKKVNPEIHAWIEIPNTRINYPIAQSATHDAYYLNHTIEGKKGYPGAIRTENINSKDFSDFNTVIYGHNMKNGTMFKGLHQYKNAEFMESHDKIYIYTEEGYKVYQVFAAIVYDDRHILWTYDNEDIEARKAFLQSVYESRNMRNQIRTDIPVDENSHIITLSTCIGGYPDNRYLVVAVEVEK